MIFAIRTAAITSLIAFATLASAQSQNDNTGFYVGADVASTRVDGLGTKAGLGILAGYQLTKNIAFEAAYRKLGTYEGTDITATQVSVLGILPIDNVMSVYGRLGASRVGLSYNNRSSTENYTLFGAGFQYNLQKNVALRAEYNRLAGDTKQISAGVVYKF